MKPCIECGVPAAETRCEVCRKPHRTAQVGSARARGYDAAHDRMSRRVRKLQPFCIDCGSTEDLQADHLPSAWERKAEGKPLRLKDYAVRCAACNSAAGSSRPGSERAQTLGSDPAEASKGLRGKPQGLLRMVRN